jgi:hypothetical protein
VHNSLLDLALTTEIELAELKPRDRIDLQSFTDWSHKTRDAWRAKSVPATSLANRQTYPCTPKNAVFENP